MTDLPERIVTRHYKHGIIDARPKDEGFACEPGKGAETAEYVRADLPAAVTVKPLEWEQMDAFAWVAHGLEPAEYHISTDDRGQTWDFQEFDDPEEPPDFSGSLEATKAHVQRVHERRILSCRTTQPDPVKGDHPDDIAVDRFAAAMKAKLADARAKGRSGWDDPKACSVEFLARLLKDHMKKSNPGNFEDIANLCMMLHQRGADPAILAHIRPDPVKEAAHSPIYDLIPLAIQEAQKGMRKFPQPNYVISKWAEETGEVTKALIHNAEGRESLEAVKGEIVQALAMLHRLFVEGDRVHGLRALAEQEQSDE